ncbi:hypothetical protein BASA62_004372 [Batrachochytrium salamandrivorans]|nr:hypothetical protein BASA62_004372 [Batrachochytrium salamandrivorans]
MKTASILVISLLAIIGGAAPAPALDGDDLQLYKRQPPPAPPIPAPRLLLLAKLGNSNPNDGTKEVEATVPNSPTGESSSLEESEIFESDEEEETGFEFDFDPDFDFNSQPMTPEEITTPEFNQQSNVKSARKQQVPLLPPSLPLPSRMWLPLPEVLPPPEDDEASESNDEAPELNDEDSNSNDGAKEVKDEPSNKPTEEVGPSKTSKFFASMRKMASGFNLRSKLGKSKPKGEGAIKGNDNSGSDLDPDDSKPQPTTPEPDQQSEIADAGMKGIPPAPPLPPSSGGSSANGVPPAPPLPPPTAPPAAPAAPVTRLPPSSGNTKAPQSGISQEELQAKISAMQAGEKGSSETPQILKPNVLSRPMGAKPSQSRKSESNSGGAIKSNDDSKSQQSKIVGVGSKGVPPAPPLPPSNGGSSANGVPPAPPLPPPTAPPAAPAAPVTRLPPSSGNTKAPQSGISQEELRAKISAMQTGEKGSSETPQILKNNVLSRPMGAKPSQSSNFQEELGKVLARKANKNGSSGESEISKHDVDPNPRKSESNSGGAIKSNDDSKSQQSKIVGVGSKGVPPPVLPKNRSRSPSNERKTAGADGSKKSSSVATTSQTSPGAGGKFPNFDPNQARPKPAVGSKPAVGPKPPVGSKPVVRQHKPEGQDGDSNDTDKEQTGRDPSTSHQQESSRLKLHLNQHHVDFCLKKNRYHAFYW